MNKDEITILFPIDLYDDISYYKNHKVFLVEEKLYFNRNTKELGILTFNILKPVYHRATMRAYYDKLIKKGISCKYIELNDDWVKEVKKHKINVINFFDPVDRYLEKKIKKNFETYNIIDSPRFILTLEDLEEYDGALKHTSFYIWARKRKNILMEKNGKFYGGKATYDMENRKKPYVSIEDDIVENKLDYTDNKYVKEAFTYVKKNINKNDLYCWTENNLEIRFPIDSDGAKNRLKNFIKNKLSKFGDYQDVFLDNDESFIFHAGLSPMMNIGLILPEDIIECTIDYFESLKTKKLSELHNVEGFIRQILGWREFNRYIYEFHSDKYLNKNYFDATNKLTKDFYTGNTGIKPIDKCIEKAFRYGYLHHIERLMIMANYMTLSKINPKQIYKWFMEFSVDSYDWVMEFNVYSMGTYSDGGIFTSKPYISGSPYLLKMSNYKNEEWTNKWNLLFWEFISENKTKVKGRLSMLINKASKRIIEIKKSMI